MVNIENNLKRPRISFRSQQREMVGYNSNQTFNCVEIGYSKYIAFQMYLPFDSRYNRTRV